jgi:tetratricopeptide (TPR) repeat protein
LAEGRISEAREVLIGSLKSLPHDDVDERLALLNLLCKVERAAKNTHEALRIHLESYPLVQLTSIIPSSGNFITDSALPMKMLGEYDRALIEYEAAKFHAEESGNLKDLGYAVVNIAMVLCELERTTEARAHLSSGRAYFAQNSVVLAQLNETEAQVCLKEEKPLEALSLVVDACQTFIRESQKKLLDDALPTLIKAASDYRCGGLLNL